MNVTDEPAAANAGEAHKDGKARKALIEKRNLISSVFVAMLLGVAFQEMLNPVRDSVKASGFRPATAFLALSFFFTSIRFFIGNQLHLLSDSSEHVRGDLWLYDFLIIVTQSIFICFLGGVSSEEVNRTAHVNFYDLLIVLYLTDIFWVLSQAVLGRMIKAWRRSSTPWPWAILNTALLAGTLIIHQSFADIFGFWSLAALTILNIVGFLIDIILLDQYHIV
jgi:hypothetical protein